MYRRVASSAKQQKSIVERLCFSLTAPPSEEMPACTSRAAATEGQKELKRAAVRYARDSGLCDRENPPGTDELEADLHSVDREKEQAERERRRIFAWELDIALRVNEIAEERQLKAMQETKFVTRMSVPELGVSCAAVLVRR